MGHRHSNHDKLYLGAYNEPRQLESAYRRGKKSRVVLQVTKIALAIATQQSQGANMTAKGSRAMMVFAMHVIGNGATQCNESGTGQHRKKPATRNDNLQYIIQRHAGLSMQDTVLIIKSNQPVESLCTDLCSMAIDTTVAVTAPTAIGQHRVCGA
jgi:hypothetical protein